MQPEPKLLSPREIVEQFRRSSDMAARRKFEDARILLTDILKSGANLEVAGLSGVVVRREIARAYFQEGSYREALEELRVAEESLDSDAPPVQLAKIFALRANIKGILSEYAEAIDLSEKAFEILKPTGENEEVAYVQKNLAKIYIQTGDFERARQFAEDSISSYRRIGDESALIDSINLLGLIQWLSSDYSRAIEIFQEGLRLCAREGSDDHRRDEAKILNNLGTVHYHLGNWDRAEEYFNSSQEVFLQLNDKFAIAVGYHHLGNLSRMRHQRDEADQLYRKSLSMAEENGYVREQAVCYCSLGEMAAEQQEYYTAQRHGEKALQLIDKVAPESRAACMVYNLMTDVRLFFDDLDGAREFAEKADRNLERMGDLYLLADLYRNRALIARKAGDLEGVTNGYQEAISALRHLGSRMTLAKILTEFARHLETTLDLAKDLPRILEPLEEARSIYSDIGSQREQADVDLAIAEFRIRGGDYHGAIGPLRFSEEYYRSAERAAEHKKATRLRQDVENRMVETALSEQNEFNLFFKITELTHSKKEGPGSITRVLSKVLHALKAERGFVALSSDRETAPKVIGTVGIQREIAREVLGRILSISDGLKPGRPIVRINPTLSRVLDRVSEAEQNVVSLMAVPFGLENRVEGLIYADRSGSSTGECCFNQKEVNLFSALGTALELSLAQVQREKLQQDNIYLREQLEGKTRLANVITDNWRMAEILKTIDKIKDSSISVLLEGETGTGKELMAKVIHYNSDRRDKKFVAVNCAALPETLLESELFGHRAGAFTGASRDKKGMFEIADGGTFLLDEVGDIGAAIQAKLLRILEEGEIKRLGETKTCKVDVRLISATNKSLADLVRAGRFREDLYYRLNALRIEVPPLRQRIEDIPLLVEFFADTFRREEAKRILGFSPESMRLLMDYRWPGNVRELKNEVKRAIILASDDSLIQPDILSERIFLNLPETGDDPEVAPMETPASQAHSPAPVGGIAEAGFGPSQGGDLLGQIAVYEKDRIVRALVANNWVQTRAARALNIAEATLRGKIKKYGIKKPQDRRRKA